MGVEKTSPKITKEEFNKKRIRVDPQISQAFFRDYLKEQLSIKAANEAGNILPPTAPPGCCKTVLSDAIAPILFDDDHNSVPGYHILSYYVSFEENTCNTGSLTYSFSFTNSYGFSSSDLGIETLCTISPAYCYNMHTFIITVQVPDLDFCNNSTTELLTSVSSSCGSTQNFSKNLPFEESYCNLPAFIALDNPITGNVLNIYTECSCLCTPCHVICPSGGTFKYRIVGTSLWTSASIGTAGTTINSMATGNYEYEATLTYSSPLSCTSKTLEGTFTIP